MRPSSTFLNSKFGRRIFLLFAGCALIPILGLAILSYRSVSRELIGQAEGRLADTGKSLVMGIWERLASLDTELQIIAARADAGPRPTLITHRSVLGEDLSTRFRAIVLEDEERGVRETWGADLESVDLTSSERVHLESGRPMLRIEDREGEEPKILLGRKSIKPAGSSLVIWSQIESAFLWWGANRENNLPAANELIVLDSSRGLQIYNTHPGSPALPGELIAEIGRGSHGGFEWQPGDTRHLGHYRTVNLRPAFQYPSLTLVVSEPEEFVTRPLASFKRGFLVVLLATITLILLLSLRQIRLSLMPLERLREGTRRVASGDFGVTVSAETDDEFGELAESFNFMATSLERQFATLESLNQLQQTVLSVFKIDRVVETVLERFGRIFPCERVAVCVMNPDRAGSGLVYRERGTTDGRPVVDLIELSAPELADFKAHRHHLEVDPSGRLPSFMPGDPQPGLRSIVAFPAFLGDELAAVIAAACGENANPTDRDFNAARQVTDQVAIGLSNARLIHQLNDLNWGTLSALARAVDVRSSWTLGHTERVTQLARDIGRSMGLSKERQDILHRGSLLHDIGKLGVPSKVLDKPGALNAEEMGEVREHVQLGARIIEPIAALADVIPIILQHHEWFDGSGYPEGLAGDKICVEARILTVADCYDALNSDRPYRKALSHEVAMEHILSGAGSQFDPQIVEAFVRVMERTHRPPPGDSELAVRLPPLTAS